MKICQFCKFQIELRRGVWFSHEGSYCDDNRGNYCHSPESAALHELVAQNDGEKLLWKEIERQSKIPSPITPPLEASDNPCHPNGDPLPKAQPEPERGTALDIRAEDLVMLLRRAVVRFRAIDDHKGNVLADSIMDYLRRKGLADGTSILREAPSPLPVREQTFDEWWFSEDIIRATMKPVPLRKIAFAAWNAAIAGEKED